MRPVRAITWIKQRGAEFAEVDLAANRMRAAGVAVGASPLPYRLPPRRLPRQGYLHLFAKSPFWCPAHGPVIKLWPAVPGQRPA
jgi:hypothetical protein